MWGMYRVYNYTESNIWGNAIYQDTIISRVEENSVELYRYLYTTTMHWRTLLQMLVIQRDCNVTCAYDPCSGRVSEALTLDLPLAC